MHWIANILVGIGAAVAGLFGGAQHLAGTTITTILGTDTLSNSRTTINDNFTNLLNGKIESSTTTLPLVTTLANLSTVGTIGSGVWQGTAVGAQYGGTGSSTLSQYQVLLGNGTGALTVPAGWGTSGQSLVSNGPGAKPSWQSVGVDQNANYTWTGTHVFATSTVYTLTTGSITATSSSNIAGTWKLLVSTTTSQAMSVATATLQYTASDLRIIISNPNNLTGSGGLRMHFNGDWSSNYAYWSQVNLGTLQADTATGQGGVCIFSCPNGTTSPSFTDMQVHNYSNAVKPILYTTIGYSQGVGLPARQQGDAVWNNTSSAITAISVEGVASAQLPAGVTISVYGN